MSATGTDNCATEAEEQLVNKKPLNILTVAKYNKDFIKFKNDPALKQAKEGKNFLQTLKDGSNKIMQKWTAKLNQKENSSGEMVESRKMMDKAIEKHQQEYKEFKENDEKIRLEKIAKGKQMQQRDEPGPKKLESAFMLNEGLKARNTQINFQNERRHFEKEKYIYDDGRFNPQPVSWIEGRILQSKKRNDDYNRAELFDCIKMQNKNKIGCTKNTFECERKIDEEVDEEVRSQIEKEKAVLQRKKDTMRKNALDAMLMVEQRRQREKVESKIEDNINSIYVGEGKHEMSMNKKEMDKNEFVDNQKATAVKHIPISTADQEDDKNPKQFCIKYDAQEREKINREKDLKAAKIRYYIEESKRQKAVDERKNEEFKWAIANRLKNEEVSMYFLMEQNREKAKRNCEIRNSVLGQIEDRIEIQKIEKIMDQRCSAVYYMETDQFFFNYANKMITDAENKSRPIYPMRKPEHYRRSCNMNIRNRELPQLKTKFSIGRNCGSSATSIIKYDLNELKQLNPRN